MIWKKEESDGEAGRGMRERKRGTAGKFLEIVVVGPRFSSSSRRRYPGAEVTLRNNSFGFMSRVVYTLRVPAEQSRTERTRILIPNPLENPSLSLVVYDDSTPLATVYNTVHLTRPDTLLRVSRFRIRDLFTRSL